MVTRPHRGLNGVSRARINHQSPPPIRAGLRPGFQFCAQRGTGMVLLLVLEEGDTKRSGLKARGFPLRIFFYDPAGEALLVRVASTKHQARCEESPPRVCCQFTKLAKRPLQPHLFPVSVIPTGSLRRCKPCPNTSRVIWTIFACVEHLNSIIFPHVPDSLIRPVFVSARTALCPVIFVQLCLFVVPNFEFQEYE